MAVAQADAATSGYLSAAAADAGGGVGGSSTCDGSNVAEGCTAVKEQQQPHQQLFQQAGSNNISSTMPQTMGFSRQPKYAGAFRRRLLNR